MYIPKKIHYCWFGGDKPELVLKCIKNWREKQPDYEIKEWNESNIPHDFKYVNNALSLNHYAFASDYIRVWALYVHGGIYLDTDVEIVKSLDLLDLDKCNGFIGFSQEEFINNAIMGAVKKTKIFGEMLSYMDRLADEWKFETSPRVSTAVFANYGLDKNTHYIVEGIKVFPKHVFYPYNPYDPARPLNNLFYEDIKEDTFTIHHYMASWTNNSKAKLIYRKLKRLSLILLNKCRLTELK
ncbi:glycosyltransferase family 32 protein [Psychromonas sp. PT13]|uniref:glycosyltransferase family 32 protein n=1 Tax=Psychromonas sp. PT13 TaxID=3439547 RepID=UPI003EBD464D